MARRGLRVPRTRTSGRCGRRRRDPPVRCRAVVPGAVVPDRRDERPRENLPLRERPAHEVTRAVGLAGASGIPVRHPALADRHHQGVWLLARLDPGGVLGAGRHRARAPAARGEDHVAHRGPVLGVEEARNSALRQRPTLEPGAHAGQRVPPPAERVGDPVDLVVGAQPRHEPSRRLVGVQRLLVVGEPLGVQPTHLGVEAAQLLAEQGDVLVGQRADAGELRNLVLTSRAAVPPHASTGERGAPDDECEQQLHGRPLPPATRSWTQATTVGQSASTTALRLVSCSSCEISPDSSSDRSSRSRSSADRTAGAGGCSATGRACRCAER